MAEQFRTNIPAPPRNVENPANAARYIWDLYKALVGDQRVLSGSVTIANLATSATVELAIDQGGPDYIVNPAFVSSTGTPPAAAKDWTGITKAAGSFTITIGAAPGAGNSVTFDWITRR